MGGSVGESVADERLGRLLKSLGEDAVASVGSVSFLVVSPCNAAEEEEPQRGERSERWFMDPFSDQISHVEVGGMRVARVRQAEALGGCLVPFQAAPPAARGNASSYYCQEARHHLRWMLQKDQLRQDMFLLGPPGPLRRWIAMLFAEMLGRQVEYISLTRDTSESDLKQRREIRGNSAMYEDLPAVTAALHGRILLIEGIEKCERNVLPVLNNLLENREMALEDGRFLVHHERYDKLLAQSSKAQLDRLRLERVHQDFTVIGLGLPVPLYPGNPMDPPLRSRFQCRDIGAPSKALPDCSPELITELVTFTEALQTIQAEGEVRLPHFPDTPGLVHILRTMRAFSDVTLSRVIHRTYPYLVLAEPAEQVAVEVGMTRILHGTSRDSLQSRSDYLCVDIRRSDAHDCSAVVTLKAVAKADTHAVVDVPCGRGPLQLEVEGANFVELDVHQQLLCEMIQDHAAGLDICLVGEKGVGKSTAAHRFSAALGYSPTVTMHLYHDMSARDLLQRRATTETGDTVWETTPLIQAALEGTAVVLDGIDRLHPSTFSVMQQLCQDRECTLFDGTKLVRWDRYDHMANAVSHSAAAKATPDFQRGGAEEYLRCVKGILRVSPSFRIVAVASLPTLTNPWMTSEVLPMFRFHYVRHFRTEEKEALLEHLFPQLAGPASFIHQVVALDDRLRRLSAKEQENARPKSEPATSASGAPSAPVAPVPPPMTYGLPSNAPGFSLRQLIRLCRQFYSYPDQEELKNVATLADAATPLDEDKLDQLINRGFRTGGVSLLPEDVPTIEIVQVEGKPHLRIGAVQAPVHTPEDEALIPKVNFFNMPKHIYILQEMLKDFTIGENLLLIGPQGVGKNMLADRLLELLRFEREYIQLHRDTTVQSLTLSPTLEDGVIKWDDSPLVSAVKHGRCLVIDEADKAPTEVVCILKGLVEDGEMLLSDGRRILSPKHVAFEAVQRSLATRPDSVINVHPDFRLIVLANKQGFPFLGNDLLAELGDCFSCHMIENPDERSELSLLKFYGPNVPEETLKSLTQLFADLRDLVEQGLLSYPYSTRELVNIVRHLEAFPEDGLVSTVENVFSFDGYDPQLLEHLTSVFHRHGIPVGIGNRFSVSLAKPMLLPAPERTEVWRDTQHDNNPTGKKDTPALRGMAELNTEEIREKAYWLLPKELFLQPKEVRTRQEARVKRFTEQAYHWEVATSGRVVDMCVLGEHVVVLTNDPVSLHVYLPGHRHYVEVELGPHLRYSSVPNMTDFPFTLRLLPLPAVSAVLLYIPSFEVGILVNVKTRSVRVLELHKGQSSLAIYNKIVYLGYKSMASSTKRIELESTVVVTDPVLTDELSCLLFFAPSSYELRLLHLGDLQAFHYQLSPELIGSQGIGRVHALGGRLLLFSGDGRLFRGEWNFEGKSLPRMQGVDFSDSSLCFVEVERLSSHTSSETRDYHFVAPLGKSDGLASLVMNSGLTHAQFTRAPAHAQPHDFTEVLSILKPHKKSPSHEGRKPKTTEQRVAYIYADEETEECIASCLLEDSSTLVKLLSTSYGFLYLEAIALAPAVASAGDGALQEPAKLRRIEVPEHSKKRVLRHFQQRPGWVLPLDKQGRVVTLQPSGAVRVWDLQEEDLTAALAKWEKLLGKGTETDELSMTVEFDGTREALGAKEGKPTDGEEHIGGNTWQGGTGGADTPGLGGKGGPYRLDGGYDVNQISEESKKQVSEEVERARKEMAAKMRKEKLRAIDMSEFSADQYGQYFDSVRLQVSQLRVILESVRAKQKERVWHRNKSKGELDDMKLVDGLVGERNIYKKRVEVPPSAAAFQEKPKRLAFLLDVSGSMYRFNGQDKRLERLLESVCLITESFQGYESKYSYSIVGHSGDGPSIPFVDFGKPPRTASERLKLMMKMKVHTEYCASGDSTLEALRLGVKNVVSEEADDYFVFLVSDANLQRYGIEPRQLASVMTSDQRVNCYSIFLASLQDEAQQIARQLPVGKGFVCLDTSALPSIFKQIFANSVLRERL